MCGRAGAGRPLGFVVLLLGGAAVGCAHTRAPTPAPFVPDLPVELNKVTLPEYVVEPPDILVINAVQLLPKPPYKVQPLDVLQVQVPNALPIAPINGTFPVDPDGTLNLGPPYGTVAVAGRTLDEAKAAIAARLTSQVKDPEVAVSVAQSRGVQQISGEHLVRTDGSVYLGTYGSVKVTGMTLTKAREQIEAHLAQFVQSPQITLDVLAYNSKLIYVVMDGAGAGQTIYRLPVTGNDTVLDALSQVSGLSPVSDRQRIWVARPSPPEAGCDQVLPVDWDGITAKGRTTTNYQLMPGDRIYVKGRPLVAVDNALARVFAPVERLFGVTLLGTSLVQQIQRGPNGAGGFGGFP